MEISPEVVFALIQSEKDFPVDFDDAWHWIGYTRKDTAKDLLTNGSFCVDIDYKIFAPDQTGAKKKGRGGHNRELIFLTIDSFKSFCMMAGTQKGREVRLYFLRCEAELKRKLEEERTQYKQNTQQQLIAAMVSEDVVSRHPKFPPSFYQMLFRKRGQGWETRDPSKFRPACVGTWTNQTVYDRMLGGTNPGGVREALNKVNPRRENGTPYSCATPKNVDWLRLHLNPVIMTNSFLVTGQSPWRTWRMAFITGRSLFLFNGNILPPKVYSNNQSFSKRSHFDEESNLSHTNNEHQSSP